MLVAASRRDPMIPFNGVEQYVTHLRQCVSEHKKQSGDHASWGWGLSSVAHIVQYGGSRHVPRGSVFFLVDRRGSHDSGDEVCVYVCVCVHVCVSIVVELVMR